MFNVTVLKSSRCPKGAYAPKDLEALAAFVLASQKVHDPIEVTIDLVGHRRIHELNRRYRGVDRTTDVISFRDHLQGMLQGDIAINLQQAALQARGIGHPLRREVRLLLIHGILHLLGYTDYEPKPRRRMFKRQNALLRHWEQRHR